MEIFICTQLLFLSKAIWIRNEIYLAPALSGELMLSHLDWAGCQAHLSPGARGTARHSGAAQRERRGWNGREGPGWAAGSPGREGQPLVGLHSRGGSVPQNMKPTLLSSNGERLVNSSLLNSNSRN